MAVDCAGALVEPGDLLVGDGDGVVVLPDDVVADVVNASVQQESEERFVLEQVRAGRVRGGSVSDEPAVAPPL